MYHRRKRTQPISPQSLQSLGRLLPCHVGRKTEAFGAKGDGVHCQPGCWALTVACIGYTLLDWEKEVIFKVRKDTTHRGGKRLTCGGKKPLSISCALEDGQERLCRTIPLLLMTSCLGENMCTQVLKARAETFCDTCYDLETFSPKVRCHARERRK